MAWHGMAWHHIMLVALLRDAVQYCSTRIIVPFRYTSMFPLAFF
jgi:hypothetical protein